MKKSSILFFAIIFPLAIISFFTKGNIEFILIIATYVVFKYIEIACEKKLPFWKPIRKFMFKYDYKPHIIKVARKNSSFITFPFLSAIEFDDSPFINLGFEEGTKTVLDKVKEDMRSSIFTVIQQIESLNNMTEEERVNYFIQRTKDAEIKDNENDLDLHCPEWRQIINN